jgi:hypothetical protein
MDTHLGRVRTANAGATLNRAMNTLMDGALYSDVQIKLQGGNNTVQKHKLFCCGSALLREQLEASPDSVLSLENTPIAVVEALVTFMYTSFLALPPTTEAGSVQGKLTFLMQTTECAKLHQLHDLIAQCCKQMASLIDVGAKDTVSSILAFSITHNLDALRDSCCKAIQDFMNRTNHALAETPPNSQIRRIRRPGDKWSQDRRDGNAFWGNSNWEKSHAFFRNPEVLAEVMKRIMPVSGALPLAPISSLQGSTQRHSHLASMLESGSFADVTINVEGQHIPVHSCILRSQSAVFDAMFKHDMHERRTASVTLDDEKAADVRTMLEYLYTATLLDERKTPALLTLAVKYALHEMAALCVIRLVQRFSEACLDHPMHRCFESPTPPRGLGQFAFRSDQRSDQSEEDRSGGRFSIDAPQERRDELPADVRWVKTNEYWQRLTNERVQQENISSDASDYFDYADYMHQRDEIDDRPRYEDEHQCMWKCSECDTLSLHEVADVEQECDEEYEHRSEASEQLHRATEENMYRRHQHLDELPATPRWFPPLRPMRMVMTCQREDCAVDRDTTKRAKPQLYKELLEQDARVEMEHEEACQQIQRQKARVEELRNQLAPEAIECLFVADKLDLADLRWCLLSFLSKNYDVVQSAANFSQFQEHPRLMFAVMERAMGPQKLQPPESHMVAEEAAAAAAAGNGGHSKRKHGA